MTFGTGNYFGICMISKIHEYTIEASSHYNALTSIGAVFNLMKISKNYFYMCDNKL